MGNGNGSASGVGGLLVVFQSRRVDWNDRKERSKMNNLLIAGTWAGYALLLLWISRRAKGKDALLPGKVGVIVQAFAYMATYISAVALVGFGGLCHRYGLQMLLVAAGNVWLGTWFVYRYLAWPTRLLQRKYSAQTPAQLLSRAYGSVPLQVFLGVITAILLVIYGSAVFKGAALIISGVLPISVNAALAVLVLVVGLSVIWGGLRGVLYTEALQGFIMLAGVIMLLVTVFRVVGGPLNGLRELALLEPTSDANRGFLSLSMGPQGMNVLSLALVTSVGIWAQPQLIQRHFALSGKSEAMRVAPLAVFALVVVVGGMYLASALSRLILGPDITSPDLVVPTLVQKLLPLFGQQLFALAIVSASLSTASALLHIASGSLWKDVLRLKTEGRQASIAWRGTVAFSALGCGLFAAKSSSIIALICTTSWSLLATGTLVPYLSLLAFGVRVSGRRAFLSSVGGVVSCLFWYLIGYEGTAQKISGLVAPGFWGMVPPVVVGTLCSAIFLFAPVFARATRYANAREEA